MRTKAVAEGGGRGRAVGTEDQTEAEPLGLLVKLRLVLATTPTQGGYVTFRFGLCGFYTTLRFFQFFQHRPERSGSICNGLRPIMALGQLYTKKG